MLNLVNSTIKIVSATSSGQAVSRTSGSQYSILPIFTGDGKKIFFQTNAALDPLDSESNNEWDDFDVYAKNIVTDELVLLGVNPTTNEKANKKTRFDNNW